LSGEQLQERARAHDLGKLRNELQRDLAQSFQRVAIPVFLHWGNNASDGLPVMAPTKKPGTSDCRTSIVLVIFQEPGNP